MTTETILTDPMATDLAWEYATGIIEVRAIEKAVLQSPEIQALWKDAERLDWLESSQDSHGFCHAGYGDYIYYAHQLAGYKTVREVIDDAMEQQT